MKRDMDTIIFENYNEIEDLIKVITKYVAQNPSEKGNATLKRFYDLLDVMEMEW